MLSQAPQRSDIRNFLVVLLSGVVLACAIVGGLAYFYSSSGRYWSHHVLLAPGMLGSIGFSEQQRGASQPQGYRFERIEFSYFDSRASKWKTVPVPQETYQVFWDMVEKDWSLQSPSEQMVGLFRQPHVAHLTFWARPEPSSGPVKAFQEVYFIPNGDIYRVELKGQSDVSGAWAYFSHGSIYERVLALFVTNP